MKLGFFIKWPRRLTPIEDCDVVIGDELYAESMCMVLSKFQEIESIDIFAPNHLPNEKLDVMIYLNDTLPNPQWAKKHVIYVQNAYDEGSDKVLKNFHQRNYDGYIFISNKLLKIHNDAGYPGIFLPFGVNTDLFYPRQKENQYDFDVAYVGNDIKGEARITKYLYPAVRYNFGLYGDWRNPEPPIRTKLQFWRDKKDIPDYKRAFYKIARGKIPQEKVPILYSSAKINLNCTYQDSVDWDVITLRTFEVLACKGFLITDRVPIAEKMMQGCMVFNDGGNNLIEKIDYYLDHDKERERISEEGYNYTIKHATIQARMRELFSYLKEIL